MPPQSRPNPAKIADEQAEVLDLRRKGHTVRAIAERTGIPRSTVQNRLDAAIAELVLPLADEVRLLELARLDTWQVRLEEQLDAGEAPERVVPVALKVQERRSRLLGLDAPERAEMTVASVAADDPHTLDVLARARQAARDRIGSLRAAEGPETA